MSTLYEYHNTGDTGYVCAFGKYWKGQTFTPSTAHKITSVKLLLYRKGSPGIITVSIRATDVDGLPTGGDLCSGTTDGNTLPTDSPYEWREITLGDGYNLEVDTKYAIVLRAPDGDNANYCGWRCDDVGTVYTRGNYVSTSNSGVSWTGYASTDCMFEEWGEAGAAPQSVEPSPVATSSALQAPGASGSGSAPITLSPIATPSIVQAPSIAGSGSAPITLSPVAAQSSIVAPAASTAVQIIELSPVQIASSVQAPAVSATGAALVLPSPVQVGAAVQTPSISGTGAAPISSLPIVSQLIVIAPKISLGAQIVSLPPVPAPSVIQAPIVVGIGAAPITLTPVAVGSSVITPITRREYASAFKEILQQITVIQEQVATVEERVDEIEEPKASFKI